MIQSTLALASYFLGAVYYC